MADVFLYSGASNPKDVILRNPLVPEGYIETSTGSLILTGFSPQVLTPVLVNTDTGSLILIGFEPTVLLPVNVSTGLGQLVLDGFAPTVELPVNVSTDTGVLTLTGFAPTVIATDILFTGTGQLELEGFSPIVTASGNISSGGAGMDYYNEQERESRNSKEKQRADELFQKLRQEEEDIAISLSFWFLENI